MVRVFIYNGDMDSLKQMYETVAGYFRRERITFRLMACAKFEDADKYLLKSASEEDIFFVDFSRYEGGFKLAAYFRDCSLSGSWVYVGRDIDGLLKALSIRPSGFISDPKAQKQVLQCLKALVAYHQKRERKLYFSFKFEGEQMRLPFEDICYFESNAKKVILYQAPKTRNYIFTAKLDDIEKVLPDFFLRCHQSYIVNMHMIRCLDTKNHVFIMYSNEEILISRRMYSQAKEIYERFIRMGPEK